MPFFSFAVIMVKQAWHDRYLKYSSPWKFKPLNIIYILRNSFYAKISGLAPLTLWMILFCMCFFIEDNMQWIPHNIMKAIYEQTKRKVYKQNKVSSVWSFGVDVNYFMLNIQIQLLILCPIFLGFFVKVSERGQ